tara:strand:- start:499 stop:708 length:210 start_codon:yes stop_codon:yes gene_type:complete
MAEQRERVEVTLARLEERIAMLSDEVRHVHREVSEIKATANRWKGAFWVIIALGSFAGFFVNALIGWSK